MKRIAFAAAMLFAVPAALAEPVEVPKPQCEPRPEYPGRLILQSDFRRKQFEREIKNFKECTTSFLAERKAIITANETAANAAVEDYNAVMKKITEAQAAEK